MTHVPSDHLAGKAKGSFRENWKAGPTVGKWPELGRSTELQ
jgi:hypothetical protein